MSKYDDEFDAMDDATFIKAITPSMESVITACFYRVLGQSSLPFSIEQVERFINLNVGGKGKYSGELVPIIVDERFRLYLWKNCDVSDGHGITYNVYVWGIPGMKNSVFTRKYWWGAYVIRSTVEKQLNLKPESLRIREYLF